MNRTQNRVVRSLLATAILTPIGFALSGCSDDEHHHDHDRYVAHDEDVIVVRDEHGWDHHGWYDSHWNWHGGWYDDHHVYHTDAVEWGRAHDRDWEHRNHHDRDDHRDDHDSDHDHR